MAIYHLHVGVVSRKTGRSAVAAAAYRSAEKLHNDYDGITHDYTNRSSVSAAAYRAGERLTNEQGKSHDFTNKRGVVYSKIILPDNAPKEYMDRETLWNAVEKSEKRKDAQTARDIDVALPVELDRREQIEIMREYIRDNFVSHGMCADFAIHDKEDGNPHAHILLTTRNVDEMGFGNKNRDWNNKKHLQSWRENWAVICNERLRAKGIDECIDHRTLEAQGIDREPTKHIGVAVKAMERAGRDSDRMREYREITARNEAENPEISEDYMRELKNGYLILDKEISILKQDAAEIRREIHSLQVKAENITERAGQITAMKARIDELKTVRQNMRAFSNRKTIDEQIGRLECSHSQAGNYFKRNYYITPEEASTEVQQIEFKVKYMKQTQERLNDKLNPLVAEKDCFVLEYQKQKLLAEIYSNELKVHAQTPQTHSEHTLETITERNFQEILKGVSPEQAKELIKRREREREQEQRRIRRFERGR